MPLPRFKSRDEVPEAFRDGYVERNSEWVPDDAGYQNKNSQLLDEKKKLQAEYESLQSQLGRLSPEQITKFREDMKRAEDDAARKAGDFDKLMTKREAELHASYEPKIQQGDKYRQQYQDLRLESAIRDAAAKAGVIAADLDIVSQISKGRRIKHDEQTDKLVVLDKDGDPTSLTVEKFFAETFKAEAPKFYQGTGGSGGGATGGTARGTNGAPTVTDNTAFLANIDAIAKGQVKVALP
jgi:hypothetical protein